MSISAFSIAIRRQAYRQEEGRRHLYECPLRAQPPAPVRLQSSQVADRRGLLPGGPALIHELDEQVPKLLVQFQREPLGASADFDELDVLEGDIIGVARVALGEHREDGLHEVAIDAS